MTMDLSKHNRTVISCVTVAILVTLLALGLRLHSLDYESLWMDEIHQTSTYGHSFKDIIQKAALTVQPPLDYWIGHVVQAFSSSDFAVRLPAALFGTGSVVLLMFIVAQSCTWPVALATGTIMAMLPFHIYFSQEARPYSLPIFLLLALLLSLSAVLEKKPPEIRQVVLLLIVSVSFLYSRALAPLVVVTVLVVILLLRFALSVRFEGGHARGLQKQLILSSAILILSITIYLPAFKLVLEMGEHYVPEASRLNLEIILNGISKFSFLPLWKAYIVQMEPLGPALFPLVVIAPILAVKSWKNDFLIFVTTFLLPMACLLHFVIFRAKTGNSFRPPYPIYISPLALILAAFTCQKILDFIRGLRWARFLRVILLVAVGMAILVVGHRAFALKSVRKKTDWRSLAAYLESSFDVKQVLIFDSLSPYNKWEPTFYGFSRYYKGQTPCLSVDKIPSFVQMMRDDQFHEPIFILFHWRNYFLTPYSQYPIVPSPWPPFDDKEINKVPSLTVKNFTGFSVIRIRNTSGNVAKDTLRIIESLIATLPSDSSTIELHLAAASLARVLGLQRFEDHLAKAQFLAPGHVLPDVRAIGGAIRAAPKPEKPES